MCGISFILSLKGENVIHSILTSLALIQNRGYDSMGICYFDNELKNYQIVKKASTPTEDCYDLLKALISPSSSHVAIGHTRWATHGGKTDANAHPHRSQHIVLVHNGIINNFGEIKAFLGLSTKREYTFISETDSEVIAHLIEYYIVDKEYTIEDALKRITQDLEGTWALVIADTRYADTYYIMRKGSPLLFGYNDNYVMCSSEVSGFIGLLNDYIVLENDDIIEIKAGEIRSLSTTDMTDYDRKAISLQEKSFSLSCEPYEHWMLKEIMEQSDTIKKAYNYGGRISNDVVKFGGLEGLYNKRIDYVVLIGCGTSFNAALLGDIYFKQTKRFKSVVAINACEFSEDDLPCLNGIKGNISGSNGKKEEDDDDDSDNIYVNNKNMNHNKRILCIFFSQSGETTDVYNCLQICKARGCRTMGIVNTVDSLIARTVDCGVYLNAGNEVSVASTKSFTSMVVVISLVALWFGQNDNTKCLNNLRYLPNSIQAMLCEFKFLNTIAALKATIFENRLDNIFILGKNRMFAVSCEAALKIKEVSYIHSEGFSAGALKHGPFALLDKANLTILLIDHTDYMCYQGLKSTFHEIMGRNTNLFIITNAMEVVNELHLESAYLVVPKLEYYNEIVFAVALQYLAYVLAIAKGINPDKPRNLAKVVSVE